MIFLDNFVYFVEGTFSIWQHTLCTKPGPYRRNLTGCAESWPQPHPLGFIKMLTTSQCWTSLKLLWLNLSESLQPGSKTWCWIFSCSSLAQVMANVTVGSVNATVVTSATTVTAPQRRRRAFQRTGRCAAGEATVCAAAASVLSQGPLETPVKNAPPALMPVVLKGEVSNTFYNVLWGHSKCIIMHS